MLLLQRVGEGLEITQGDRWQWRGDEGQEAVDIGAGGVLSLPRPPVEPEIG